MLIEELSKINGDIAVYNDNDYAFLENLKKHFSFLYEVKRVDDSLLLFLESS